MPTRRRFLASAAGAAAAACAGGSAKRPNVLFLMPDQWRGMDFGAAGNPDVRTPNIDRLASGGVRLRNTFANCPVCCPARGTVLTGKFAHRHGVDVNDAPLPSEETTLAEILRERGYRTGFVGKWHLEGGKRLPGFVPPGPRRQGFDFWAANVCSHSYWNMSYFRDSPEPIPMNEFADAVFTDEAARFLEADKETPFFLAVWWTTPHNPYVAPPDYMNLYDPDALTLRANWREGARLGSRNDLAGYYAAIHFLDDQIGRLLGILEADGRAENTIVLLTSDHGDMLGSQGTVLKRKPWEESVAVPGVVRYPAAIPAGGSPELLFSHVDMAPTLLGLAGVEPPSDMDGLDLSGFLTGAREQGRPESVFLQSYTPTEAGEHPPWRGVRTERYTYARHAEGPWLLYDNRQDPFQLDNLAGSPEHAGLERELDEATMAWFARTGDDWRERRDLPYR